MSFQNEVFVNVINIPLQVHNIKINKLNKQDFHF